MAQHSNKSEEIEGALTSIIGQDRRVAISRDMCQPKPIECGGLATSFKDEISRKEYSISGLCQKCQDSIFG